MERNPQRDDAPGGSDPHTTAGRAARGGPRVQRGLKARLYRWLELGSAGDPQGRIVDRVLVVFIFATVMLVLLESSPDIEARWGGLLYLAELCVGATFLAEYAARLWVADLHPPYRRLSPLVARWRYARQSAAIIDLLAILPFLVSLLTPFDQLQAFVVLRLLRFLKLARYSPALRSLANAIGEEKHAIVASLIIIFGAMILSATAMHLAEGDLQPDVFGSIPRAMWWATATLTTVGYGDAVPISALGKMIGGVVMLLGYGLLALPVGIVATAFAREIHSRDFVVTWGMVARVPLFEDLKAAEIAEIARLLRAQSVRAGTVVSRRGDETSRMYFIADGAVEVEIGDRRLRLEEGAFFGEMAILGHRRSLAEVTALEPTQLMVLEAHDLNRLMREKPDVARKVLAEVEERTREVSAGEGGGDIMEEELASATTIPGLLDDEPAQDEPEEEPEADLLDADDLRPPPSRG
jgi:voltage-gated potassium channel